MHHHLIPDIVIVLFILIWLTYSVSLIIYLNVLTTKYLLPINRDPIVKDKELKSYTSILKQYETAQAINILVLSGGGVRGLVPLQILSYMEQKTGKKVGELFDFFSGTSTGAITVSSFTVADAQGNYKFSATDMWNKYCDNINQIFSSPWYHQLLTLFGLFAPRFLPDGKMQVLEQYFGNTTIGELKGNLLIPVYNIDSNNVQIIKNWDPIQGKLHDNYLVKDLINGASSPPMLFSPRAFELKGKSHLLIDPAVLLNNPVLHVILYMKMLFPDKRLNLVVIGNGGLYTAKYDYRNMFSFGLYGLYQYLFSAPSLSAKLSIDFMEEYLVDTHEAQHYDKQISFFRFNSTPNEYLSPTDTSIANLNKIKQFAKKLLEENLVKVDELIKVLISK